MGLSDFFSDLYAAITIQDVHAEAPSSDMNDSQDQSKGVSTTSEQAGNPSVGGGASTHSPAARSDETSSEESEVNKADARKDGESDDTGHRPRKGGEGDKDDDEEKADSDEEDDDASEGDEKEDGEDEEEEEEEEEPEDLKPKLEEECSKTKQCAPHKHHYDDCVERVTTQIDNEGKAKEDCVEEFFHLAHCASQCAAPKLFNHLK